jgi:hypothetical protein
MEVFIMTVNQRIRALRLMEKMDKSSVCVKGEDGTLKYKDKDGNVLIEARMKERS